MKMPKKVQRAAVGFLVLLSLLLWGQIGSATEEINIERDVPVSQGTGATPNAIARVPGVGYVVAGSAAQAWAAGLSSDGQVLWEYFENGKPPNPNLRSGASGILGIMPLRDGTILFCGHTDRGPRTGRFALLLHLDAKGQVLDRQELSPSGQPGDRGGDIARCVPWGDGYAIFGSFNSGVRAFEQWLTKLDADGHVLWQKAGGGDSPGRWEDAVEVADGGLVLVTRTVEGSQVVRVNKNGEVVAKRSFNGYGDYKFLRSLEPSAKVVLSFFDLQRRSTFFALDKNLQDVEPFISGRTVFIKQGIHLKGDSTLPVLLVGSITRGGTGSMLISAIELIVRNGIKPSTHVFEPLFGERRLLESSSQIEDVTPSETPGVFVLVRDFSALRPPVIGSGTRVTWVRLTVTK